MVVNDQWWLVKGDDMAGWHEREREREREHLVAMELVEVHMNMYWGPRLQTYWKFYCPTTLTNETRMFVVLCIVCIDSS